MARWVEQSWAADPALPGPKRTKRGFKYRAFVPDAVAERGFDLPAEVVSLLTGAERAIIDLNRNPPALGPLEVLARRLLRAESVASSRIEGLELSQRRLARAEAGGADARDETARSVLANIAAMEKAIGIARQKAPLRVESLNSVHASLMAGLDDAGKTRTEQNWIGGNPYNPVDADFVPPPPGELRRLLDDLCAFLNETNVPVLAQAAVAHAQFETIHPYADGNGRVGRALIHIVLRRRGLAPNYVPPISLVLAGNARRYIEGLTAFREGDVTGWIGFFCQAAAIAASKSVALAARFEKLQAGWLERAGQPRTNSSAAALIRILPAHPILSVQTAQEAIGRSKQAANEAMALLEARGVLKRVNIGKRNRAWEAKEVFDVLNDFERDLAAPLGGVDRKRPAPHRGRGQSRSRR